MLVSQFLLATEKETPADAELSSHQLMLRAGMVCKLASGLYSWLPLGLRVLRKVETIVREEMNRAGALEILMPAVQPAQLWQETGRWEIFGNELLKIKDRHEHDFCYGPTHEEVITDIARREIKSYKQLPINFFQIQTKFRDEIRPRFGVMRAREFIMKDAYSFDIDDESMAQSYNKMYDTYTRIFTRLGLNFRAVLADTGSIGGKVSQEFHVLAESGEDLLAYSDGSDYAANIEKAEALAPNTKRTSPTQEIQKVATPGLKSIQTLEDEMGFKAAQSVKTLIVKGSEAPLVALILRGDHELNEIKAAKIAQIAEPLLFATDEEIHQALGCTPGSLGPVDLSIPYIVDRDAAVLADFVCGANEEGVHYNFVNWERDVKCEHVEDLRNVVAGDLSPDNKGRLQFTRGIEVGHIFQLGDHYSRKMGLSVLAENGKAIPPKMGCYGIGVSRIVAAAIEQNHDERGIIWPESMAPFQIAITPIQMHKSYRVREVVEKIYAELKATNLAVLLDDRKERPGVMFADMDLIGIPHRIIIGERGLDAGKVEYKFRGDKDSVDMPLEAIVAHLQKVLAQ